MRLNKEKALRELGITEDIYNDLVKDFLGQAEQAMEGLTQAMGRSHFEEIAKKAHFIKGAAGNLRMDEIQSRAREVELAGKERLDTKSITEKMGRLKVALDELRQLY